MIQGHEKKQEQEQNQNHRLEHKKNTTKRSRTRKEQIENGTKTDRDRENTQRVKWEQVFERYMRLNMQMIIWSDAYPGEPSQ